MFVLRIVLQLELPNVVKHHVLMSAFKLRLDAEIQLGSDDVIRREVCHVRSGRDGADDKVVTM